MQPLPEKAKVELPLVDGVRIDWLGVFHDSLVVGGLKSFHSEELSVSLKYPDDYLLFENEGGEGISAFHSLRIIREKALSQSITYQQAGLPASIGITFYPKPESLSLETWMREDEGHSNFHASDPSNNLTSTTVAGLPAFKYHSSFGLFENDYIAFRYGRWMVLAAVNADPNMKSMKSDFQTVLSSFILQSK